MPVEEMEWQEYELPDNIEDCEADSLELQDEIDTIKAQLQVDNEGLFTHVGPRWRGGAVTALVIKLTDQKKIKRRIKELRRAAQGESAVDALSDAKSMVHELRQKLTAAEDDVARRVSSMANLKEQLRSQKEKNSIGLAKSHLQVQRQSARVGAAIKFARDNTPQIVDELYSAIGIAEARFDQQFKLGAFSE